MRAHGATMTASSGATTTRLAGICSNMCFFQTCKLCCVPGATPLGCYCCGCETNDDCSYDIRLRQRMCCCVQNCTFRNACQAEGPGPGNDSGYGMCGLFGLIVSMPICCRVHVSCCKPLSLINELRPSDAEIEMSGKELQGQRAAVAS